MVLKVVNWVHNDEIESYGLERSQLSTQCKYQVIWSWKSQLSTQYKKYRGYLLRQVVFHFTEKSMDFSVWCCPVEDWVGNMVFAVSEFNLPENVFRPKSVVFIKIHRFLSKSVVLSKSAVFIKIQFSSKSMVFIKIRGFVKICSFHQIHSFHQNPQFLSKSSVFVKIHSFRQNPWFSSKSVVFGISLSFQEDNIK